MEDDDGDDGCDEESVVLLNSSTTVGQKDRSREFKSSTYTSRVSVCHNQIVTKHEGINLKDPERN